MNLYGALNNDLREFKKKEQIRLKESVLKPTNEEIKKDNAQINAKKVKEVEDKIGELRLALQDGAISADEKKEVEKQIAELEDSLHECDSKIKKEQEDENTIKDSESSKKDDTSKVIPLKDEEQPERTDKDMDINECGNSCKKETEDLKESPECIDNAISKLQEILDILDSERSIDTDVCRTKVDEAIEILGKHQLETMKDGEQNETIKECEIKSFRVIRKSPKFNAYMLEAETKEGMMYLTGKSFNQDTKILDEAEMSDNKDKATERFKSLLK